MAQDSVCMKASASWELYIASAPLSPGVRAATQVTTLAKQITTANPPAGGIVLAVSKQQSRDQHRILS